MFNSEIDNFVFKFHQLRRAGMTAHLDLDTHAGQAWVGLRVMLGPSSIHQDHPPASKNRSPSYYRRQARRKAARETIDAELKAEEAKTKASDSQVVAAKDAEKASETIVEAENVSDGKKGADSEKVVEKANKASYQCDICDFVSNRVTGLRIHMTRKHATIEQLDGNIEEEDEIPYMWKPHIEKYDVLIENYLKTGKIDPELKSIKDICDIQETLGFVLSPYSHMCKTLSSEQKESEDLLLLEAAEEAYSRVRNHIDPS